MPCSSAEHRYQSAAALAEDLRAFLENEPLRHAPQLSRVERFRKWMRRHPRIASSSSVAGVAAALLITAMTALFSVRTHLESAEVQVQANTVRDKLRRHDAGTVRALCLINTVAEQDSHIRQGIEVCEKTLALFGSADRGNGEEDAGWQYLEPEERERLAQNTRELLLLLAWCVFAMRRAMRRSCATHWTLSIVPRPLPASSRRPPSGMTALITWLSWATVPEPMPPGAGQGDQTDFRAGLLPPGNRPRP